MKISNFALCRSWRPGMLIAGVVMTGVMIFSGPEKGLASRDYRRLPASVKLVLKKVRDRMKQNDHQGAIDHLIAFRRGQEKNEKNASEDDATLHPLIYLTLGNCYLVQEDYVSAKKALSDAVRDDPESVEGWVNLGKAFYELKQYDEAAKCYDHAYEHSDPADPEYLFFNGVSRLLGQQYMDAVRVFDALFNAHKDQIRPQWQENYVHALLGAGRSHQALPLIKELIASSEGETKIKWQEVLLHLYLQLEKPQQALTYADTLARDDCIEPKWWKALVHVHLILVQYEKALAALTVYGYLVPFTKEERKLWANLNLQLNIPVHAAPVYEALLKEKPDKGLLRHLLVAYQRLDRPKEALARLNAFHPAVDDPELCMLKGDMLYEMKRFQDAKKAYQRAAAKADAQTAGRAWLMAGYAAWQSNDVEAGRRAFENAIRYRKQRKAAKEALARIKKM